jgi:hypothetical protein
MDCCRDPEWGVDSKQNYGLAVATPDFFVCPSLESKLSGLGIQKNHEKKNFSWFCFVGVAGFEPATSWSQTRRANRTTLYPVLCITLALKSDAKVKYIFKSPKFYVKICENHFYLKLSFNFVPSKKKYLV